MIFCVFHWRTIVLFQAQLEEQQIEPVAHAICLEHGILRAELAITYRERIS